VKSGFQDMAAYLQARHVGQGWSVKRIRAELGLGPTMLGAPRDLQRVGYGLEGATASSCRPRAGRGLGWAVQRLARSATGAAGC
jgi:hypothetical protein